MKWTAIESGYIATTETATATVSQAFALNENWTASGGTVTSKPDGWRFKVDVGDRGVIRGRRRLLKDAKARCEELMAGAR